MNYLFKTILFSVCILTTSFTVKEDQNKLKTGFYYLAEKETEGELIKDIDSEEWFAVQKEDALAVNEYTAAKFTTRNYLPKAMKVIVAERSAPMGRPISIGMSRKNQSMTITNGIDRIVLT